MRKHFLFTAVLLSFCLTGTAFATGGLFPELKKQTPPTEAAQNVENLENVELFNEADAVKLNQNPEEEFKEITDGDLKEPIAQPTPKKENEEEDEKKKEKKEQVLEIHPHAVQIITPVTGQNNQLCVGRMTLENKTNHTLKALRVLLTYGGVEVPYEFSNLGPDESVTGQISLMGRACQDLIKQVPVKPVICKAEGISDSECKSMVKYVIK